jgi:hypothetical protein
MLVQGAHLESCGFDESLAYVGHRHRAPPSYLPASILIGYDVNESMLITSTRCTHKARQCQVDNECQPLEQSMFYPYEQDANSLEILTCASGNFRSGSLAVWAKGFTTQGKDFPTSTHNRGDSTLW